MKKIYIAVCVLVSVCAFSSYAYADDPVTPDPIPTPQETILIRNGNSVIYSGTIPLPASGTIDIPDASGNPHTINSQSVLGVLYALSISTNAFTLSDVQYYSSFNSLYLKCVTPAGGSSLCDSWHDVVNNSTPTSGMDATLLLGGETIGVYFGNDHQLVLDSSSITSGSIVTVHAQKYNYVDNTWQSLSGVTVGLTLPNPNDQYNPTIIATYPVDANGSVTFTTTTPNVYTIGIVEDYYYPGYQLIVTTPQGDAPAPEHFDTTKAVSYLLSMQKTDGSFGSLMYTDWASIALSSANVPSTNISSLLSYMSTISVGDMQLTDIERHSMALLSLGQNPYTYNEHNYINEIIQKFDGVQFGDPNVVNDDIFALLPLSKVGYTTSDEIITKDITFIISKQDDNGSWDESVDMTAASLQALAQFPDTTGVSLALSKGAKYIEDKQGHDGSFGSVYTTSWVLGALNMHLIHPSVSFDTPDEYFATLQSHDGGMLSLSDTSDNRIWATSYVIPGALGFSWTTVMHDVPRVDTPITEIKTLPTITVEDIINDITSPTFVSEDIVRSKKHIIAHTTIIPTEKIVVLPVYIPQQEIHTPFLARIKDVFTKSILSVWKNMHASAYPLPF